MSLRAGAKVQKVGGDLAGWGQVAGGGALAPPPRDLSGARALDPRLGRPQSYRPVHNYAVKVPYRFGGGAPSPSLWVWGYDLLPSWTAICQKLPPPPDFSRSIALLGCTDPAARARASAVPVPGASRLEHPAEPGPCVDPGRETEVGFCLTRERFSAIVEG